jgi:hypothetical protein
MHDIIGWIGAALYVIAYFLLSIKKLQADRLPYQALNILGGVCLIVSSSHHRDYPSMVTNAVWAAVAMFSIYYNRKE